MRVLDVLDSPLSSGTTKGSSPRLTRSSGVRPHLGGFGRAGTGTNFPSRVRAIGPRLFEVKSVVLLGCGGGGTDVDAHVGGWLWLTRRFFVGGSSMGSKSSARGLPGFGMIGLVGGYKVGSNSIGGGIGVGSRGAGRPVVRPPLSISPSIAKDNSKGGALGGGVSEGLMSRMPSSRLIELSGTADAPSGCFF